MMDLSTFLDHWVSSDGSNFDPIVCFYGIDEMPCLFFGHLIQTARTHASYRIECLDIRETSFDEYKPHLLTSFLGGRVIYWLSGLATLSEHEQTRIYTWLARYSGPHTLVFFSGKRCAVEQRYGIQLPEYIDKTLCNQLVRIHKNAHEHTSKNLLALLSKLQRISLEKACLLMQYSAVLGRIDQTGVQEWLGNVLMPEASLFQLSKMLLAKEEQHFFTSWAKVHDQYPGSFWVAFWSEQLWRAAVYTQCMQEGRHGDAKVVGNRLPFAFLQRGWQSACLSELKQAHTFIYQLDSSIKRGGHEYFLDLMYLKFFAGNFAGSVADSKIIH